MPYLDNVYIKGLKTKYEGETVELGIWQFVTKHLSNINQVLADIKRASATVSRHKLDFYYASIVVVGY
jgi:hypothetical protein